jgi:hypothetical protein
VSPSSQESAQLLFQLRRQLFMYLCPLTIEREIERIYRINLQVL